MSLFMYKRSAHTRVCSVMCETVRNNRETFVTVPTAFTSESVAFIMTQYFLPSLFHSLFL